MRQIEEEIKKQIKHIYKKSNDQKIKDLITQFSVFIFPFDTNKFDCNNSSYIIKILCCCAQKECVLIDTKYRSDELQTICIPKTIKRPLLLKFISKFYATVHDKKLYDNEILFYLMKEYFPEINKDIINDLINRLIEVDKNLLVDFTGLVKSFKTKKINTVDIIENILQKNEVSMHYSEITNKVNKKFSKKYTDRKVLSFLVNSDRFINTGKGKYALTNSGYSGLQTGDLIYEFLKQKGTPQNRQTIKKYVLSRKDVLELTIFASISYTRSLTKK